MAVKKSKQANIIVQQLSFSTPKRENIDINKWRSALKSAENETNPRRASLYDIYNDILLDAHLSSVITKRKTIVLNSNVQFITNGDVDEKIQEHIESPWFRKFISDLIDTRFWGHSVFQFYKNGEWINYDLIPRKHIEPINGILLKSATDTAGIPYRDGAFNNLLESGENRSLGLLLNAAPWVIYKRNCMGDYAQYAELFGQPLREGIYDGYDEVARQKLKEDLEQMGSSGVFIHPENTQIKLIDTTDKSGNSKLYTDLVALCNAEISKLILGNTLTTEQGNKGTQSLGTVHKEIEEQITDSDKRFILDVLNYDLTEIFASLGINTSNGEFRFEDKQLLNLNEKIIIDMQIASKVPVDDDYWYQTYDIPKPKNYKKLKAEQDEQRKAMQQISTDVATQRLKQDKNTPENAFKRFLNFFA